MAASTDGVENAESTLRKRRPGLPKRSTDNKNATSSEEEQNKFDKSCAITLQTGTYWLTRIVLLRSIAFIYFVAFFVAYNQNKQLIGERGLMPCKEYLGSVKRYVGGKIGFDALAYTPTLLWFLDWADMDANLDGIALAGLALSGFVLLMGTGNMVIMALLWVLYHSLVSVGQLWYSFDILDESGGTLNLPQLSAHVPN